MKKVIRLTESDLMRIVKRVISENQREQMRYGNRSSRRQYSRLTESQLNEMFGFKEKIMSAIDKAKSIAARVTSKLRDEFEIQVSDFKIYQIAQEYPIGKKDHGPEFLLDKRHLWLRSPKQWAIQRVRDTLIHATYNWMRENNFIKIDSPILTPVMRLAQYLEQRSTSMISTAMCWSIDGPAPS